MYPELYVLYDDGVIQILLIVKYSIYHSFNKGYIAAIHKLCTVDEEFYRLFQGFIPFFVIGVSFVHKAYSVMKHFMIGAYDIIRSGFYRYEMEYKTIDEFILVFCNRDICTIRINS